MSAPACPFPSEVANGVRKWIHALRERSTSKTKNAKPLKPVLISAADITPSKVDWEWFPRIAVGKLSLLSGDPGTSKSILTTCIAAALSTGTMLPGEDHAHYTATLFLCAEDGKSDTVVPRLVAAGADLKMIAFLDGLTTQDGQDVPISLESHISGIEDAVDELKAHTGTAQVMVVIDPINAFLGAKVKSHIDQDVRRVLAPLAKMAERTGSAIVLVNHLNRGDASTAMAKVGGSTGLVGSVRTALILANHPQDPTKRVLSGVKTNVGPFPKSLAYEITETADGIPFIRWAGECDYTANDLIRPPETREEREALVDAREFITTVLADGPRPSAEVLKLAAEHNHAKGTMERGKKGIAESFKPSFDGAWYWRLVGDLRPPLSPDGTPSDEGKVLN